MKRILVIKLSSLGDIAHALPAVRALKERTGADIDWVVQPEYAGLLAMCPDVSRRIAFPRRRFAAGFLPFVRELRGERYDLILDLQGLMKSAFVGRLALGDWRVGPAWAREGAHWFYDVQTDPAPGPRLHAVEELMELVNLVAPGDSGVPEPNLVVPEAPGDGSPGPHVALAPFSRWQTKNWPLEKFAELGRGLAAEMGCRLCIVGGPDDQARGAELAQQIGERARNLCGQTDLPGLCSLLKSMDLLVSVDSGPLHWADAMGVPLIVVFGATDPGRTGPYWQRAHVVAVDGLACRPCHARTCARGDLACLETLDVAPVLQAVLARL
ncbi:MAG: glycosyltransferase family 9 protein [Kiritimatiellae bacterium]|jgi:lipopolysaccharide heptosyltransferase I|nr:glycosyltransferase family 9 protein [Kiritimatiellia bacterium]NLD89926.1 glycosyltransferase family 9 protein [Lentisphaerota bacterium]HPC18674.1 glycosyltransferase family 9 protein [Kiritimatiellia bacterium]HQN80174.1 glycosyltransferase family 9 protein [Kiritimatiellia bacterium]